MNYKKQIELKAKTLGLEVAVVSLRGDRAAEYVITVKRPERRVWVFIGGAQAWAFLLGYEAGGGNG